MHYFISDFDTKFARKQGSKDKIKRKSKLGIGIAALGTTAILGAGGYLALRNKKKPTLPTSSIGVPVSKPKPIRLSVKQYPRVTTKKLNNKTTSEIDNLVQGGYKQVKAGRLFNSVQRGIQRSKGSKIRRQKSKKINFSSSLTNLVLFARKLGSKDKRKRKTYAGLNPISIGGATSLLGLTGGMLVGNDLDNMGTKIKNPIAKSMIIGAGLAGTAGYLSAKNFNKKLGLTPRRGL